MLLPRMTIPPSFSCENDTSLYTREAFFGVLVLLFGVAFIDCRGDHRSSVIYKNIILFKKDRQFAKQIWTHGPYKICGIFDILSVG